VKRTYAFFCLLICFYSGKAQIATLFTDELAEVPKTRMGITADYFINANSFTTQFITKFYKGGFIDASLKDQVSARTKNSNRAGAELNYGLFASFRLDSLFNKPDYHLFFNVRDRQHVDAQFSKDFYQVGFYGNSAYAGKTANFNNFSIHLLRYQQIQIGLFSTRLDSGARWGIALSFLKGEQYYAVSARKAELFTSADAQFIDFNTEIEMAQSRPDNKGMSAINGFGAAFDAYFEAPFQSAIGPSKLIASVADMGLLRFDDQSIYRKQDSLFHYTGFQIKSIFDLQDSLFLNTSQDSIQNKLFPETRRSVTATLPSTFNLSLETALSKNFRLTEGIRYIFNANYKLLAYVKGSVFFNNRVALSATIGYGGYGDLNYGIGFGANLGAGFLIQAGCNNLEGYVTPTRAAGQSAYFSIIKNFN
jgi:hypothetical protein